MYRFPFYQAYELNHAAVAPVRAVADAARLYFQHPLNPFANTAVGKAIAAGAEVFERATRRYAKPAFGLGETTAGGVKVPVAERVVWERPFCRLIHFERVGVALRRPQPKVLIVAPLSGHYATLLRGTVAAFLPGHEVFVTDWADARTVPVSEGSFDLDDCIDYLISMLHALGPAVHMVGVCQPAVPVLAATAVMAEAGDPCAPASMILMGGPIDARINPTAVTRHAASHTTDWFRQNVIMTVPFPHRGFMRQVYPGFLQLSGFMAMNLERHVTATREFYQHLVEGDGDSAQKHREFYDEYLAVMDLTAEFFLQTVDTVFQRFALPTGTMTHRGKPVRPQAIRDTALLVIEGERDDISGVGQTKAALDLTPGIPADKKAYYLQPTVGHYGVFNGSRFRAEVAPRIADFIATHELRTGQVAKASAPGPAATGHGPTAIAEPADPVAAAVEQAAVVADAAPIAMVEAPLAAEPVAPSSVGPQLEQPAAALRRPPSRKRAGRNLANGVAAGAIAKSVE